MLGGRMSNQDEDEVEDELEAMEREVAGVQALPEAPNGIHETMPEVPQETPKQKQERRAQERATRQQASEPLAA